MLILHSYYADIAQVLCANVMQMSYRYYANIVLLLCSYFTDNMQILYRYYLDNVQILYGPYYDRIQCQHCGQHQVSTLLGNIGRLASNNDATKETAHK